MGLEKADPVAAIDQRLFPDVVALGLAARQVNQTLSAALSVK